MTPASRRSMEVSAMMVAERNSPYDRLAAALPRGVYFLVSTQILNVARNLVQRRILGVSGLGTALRWSNRLSRAGMQSWRFRLRQRNR